MSEYLNDFHECLGSTGFFFGILKSSLYHHFYNVLFMMHVLRRLRLNHVNVYIFYDACDIRRRFFSILLLILFIRNRKERVSQCRKMEHVKIIL